MKKSLLLGLFTLGFLAVSCQQKPAEKPAGKSNSPPNNLNQPSNLSKQQPAQQPAGEQKPAEQPKSEAKPAQPTAMADAEDLAKAKGCYACHDVNAKKVGPAFKDVAKKYTGKPDAVAHLSERSRKVALVNGVMCPCPLKM
jgi:cytochrome c